MSRCSGATASVSDGVGEGEGAEESVCEGKEGIAMGLASEDIANISKPQSNPSRKIDKIEMDEEERVMMMRV